MEGWRQRRLGSKAKISNLGKEKNKNHLDTNRPSHGRSWKAKITALVAIPTQFAPKLLI
jgi:hypothetical protein